jgi:hypothetical protein
MSRADLRLRLAIRAAKVAGTVVRIVRGPGRALPGIAGAAAVSVGLGEVAGHVFGHHLAPWVALLTAGVLLMWVGYEINRAPKSAPRDPEGL